MDYYSYEFELAEPLVTSVGAIERRRGFVVRVERDGFTGFGEAAPMAGFSIEDEAQTEHDLRLGLEVIQEIGPVDSLTELPSSLCSSARFALELALLDWMAKQADAPLSFLLGGEGASFLPLTALVRSTEDARAAVERGHRVLKLKVGTQPLADEVRRLEQLVEDLEGQVILRLDANGAFSIEQAIPFFEAVAHLPIESVEDPLSLDALESMSELMRFRVGLGVDEALRHPQYVERVFTPGFVDYVVLKPMWCGGLLQAHAMGMAAAQRGIGVALSTALEGAIGRAGSIQLAAALPQEALWPSGVDTGSWLKSDHAALDLVIADGHLHLGLLPGIGISELL